MAQFRDKVETVSHATGVELGKKSRSAKKF